MVAPVWSNRRVRETNLITREYEPVSTAIAKDAKGAIKSALINAPKAAAQ